MKTLQAICACALFAYLQPAQSQDYTHPLKMKLPPSEFERPDPAEFELSMPNGLIAYVARANQVPLVTLSAFVRAGTVSDETPGAAEALLEALTSGGPADSTPVKFQDALRRMTAEYDVTMHDEWTEISLNVPAEDLEEALGIFADVIRSPHISADAIESAAARSAPRAAADLGAEAGTALYEGSLKSTVRLFHDVLFAKHPFGATPSEEDFGKLRIHDVVAFHNQQVVSGNIVLAVAGDIDREEIATQLTRLFGDMPAVAGPEPVRTPDVAPMKRRQHTYPVDKLQSWLVFGHDLPKVPFADRASLEVMNYILAGGHLWTRMTIETRYKYGYTNDASGFLEDRWFGPGSYTFRSYSRHDVIEAIYDNMMHEIMRIRNEPVSDREMMVAKGALTEGDFQVRYLDGYAMARNFALEKLRYGNHQRSQSYVDRIRAVTAEDVQRAAKKYLRPEKMQVVLVGAEIDLLN